MHSHIVCFRVTSEDLRRLRDAAAQDGVAMATLIRFAVSEWLALSDDAPRMTETTSLCARSCNTTRPVRP